MLRGPSVQVLHLASCSSFLRPSAAAPAWPRSSMSSESELQHLREIIPEALLVNPRPGCHRCPLAEDEESGILCYAQAGHQLPVAGRPVPLDRDEDRLLRVSLRRAWNVKRKVDPVLGMPPGKNTLHAC